MKHSHYKKNVAGLEFIDVYRVLALFGVTDPCMQHALKKVICAGQRGAKGTDRDIQEAIDTLQRWQEMRAEDEASTVKDSLTVEWPTPEQEARIDNIVLSHGDGEHYAALSSRSPCRHDWTHATGPHGEWMECKRCQSTRALC